ncbi:MAG TPA: hypothetical protein ENN09_00455 [Planctomycetes bacterium]|nr:hypothetical protein [Planctomycetota bacterium]
MRSSALLGAAAFLLVSCGGAVVSESKWEAAQAEWSKPVNGLALSLQTAQDVYQPRTPLTLKVGFKNTMLKARYLDTRGGYEGLSLVVIGPDGKEIEAGPGDESMSAAGDFVRLEAGRSVELVVQGPATANWSYKLAEPGSYTVYAVYHAEFSEQWNRESAAGGRFENQVLFTGTAESPEVSFEIQAPKKR